MDWGATQPARIPLPDRVEQDLPARITERASDRPRLRAADEWPSSATTLSVIVPATNAPPTLDRCIEAILLADDPPEQLIVVDDPAMGGAGGARNAGAREATGDILVFVDADVVVHRDAFTRIRAAFEADPGLTAVFGSYDADRGAPGVVTRFRNLLHHHVHQAARGPIGTFWAGLGAIERTAFEQASGFDPSNPVEDIELGVRMAASGARVQLDRELQGTHLKRWTLREMVLTDFIVRGAPWVELMIRHRARPNGLNLGWRHRLSALACLATLGGLLTRRRDVAAPGAVAFVTLNRSFYALLLRRAGPVDACLGVGLHAIHHLVAVASVPAGGVLYLAKRTAPPLPVVDPVPLTRPVAVAAPAPVAPPAPSAAPVPVIHVPTHVPAAHPKMVAHPVPVAHSASPLGGATVLE